MVYDPHLLDEIRARVKVSDVVGARYQLRKNGSEFVAVEDQSLTVNDQKGIWHDFGSKDTGGDIFEFLRLYEGYSFVDAVEELAKRAGVDLPKNGVHRTNGSGHGGHDGGRADRHEVAATAAVRAPSGRKEVVSTWDYLDPEGNLLYQVARMQERLADGSWKTTREGKVWKTFMQRRPDGDGRWILGLDVMDRKTGMPLEFVRTEKGDNWMRATDERKAWRGAVIKVFPTLGNVDHWLYNANAVIDELEEPREDQRTIFLPEGEAKVDVLKEWGLLAVTNSGGAQNFTAGCAEFFRAAADMVILQDNDKAGAERVARIGPMLLAMGCRVRALNFRDVWPDCPTKGDVKDWRDQGGTRDELLKVVDELKDWAPEPYRSRYGARTWRDLSSHTIRAYPWRIKGLVPRNDNTLIMGPSRSGKTFLTLDLCMRVHFGLDFAGRKVEAGGIVYLAYEGATGMENRVRAYIKHHGLTDHDLHSFAWLTRPPGIYASEDNVTALADEICKIAEGFKLPLAAIVVDTNNSATRGSSEIKSDDITKIMDRYATLSERTQAPLWIVGHTNAEGRHRGNEQFFNNIETAHLIERVMEDAKNKIEKRDDDHRVVRRMTLEKMRDGEDKLKFDFVLQVVDLGTDADGDPITSMVAVEPAGAVPAEAASEIKREKGAGFHLNKTEVEIFKKLLKVTDEKGLAPPADLELPASVTRVARWLDLSKEYRAGVPRNEGETPEKYSNRVKASGNRFKAMLMNRDSPIVMVREGTDPVDGKKAHFIWWTGRPVQAPGFQWPRVARKPEPAKPILAPGEDDIELPPDVF